MKIQYNDGVYYATYRSPNGHLRFVMAPTMLRAIAIATFCMMNNTKHPQYAD